MSPLSFRRSLRLLPLVPAVALLSSVYLPFVNQTGLWFGLPALAVWCAFWVLVMTPVLLLVERFAPLDSDEADTVAGDR